MKVTVDRRRLRARMIEEDKNSLIKALKQDDAQAAHQALSGMSGDDFNPPLTPQEFNELAFSVAGDVKFANPKYPGTQTTAKAPDLNKAKQILGIVPWKSVDADHPTNTNPKSANPVTGGPAKPGQQKQQKTTKDQQLTPDEVNLLHSFLNDPGDIKSLSELPANEIEDFYKALRYIPDDPLYDSIITKVERHYKERYGKSVDDA